MEYWSGRIILRLHLSTWILLIGFLIALTILIISLRRSNRDALLDDLIVSGDLKKIRQELERDSRAFKARRGSYPLHLAANRNQSSVVKLLLEYGVDVDSRNYHDETPLHHAARSDKRGIKTATVLLSHGADINARTSFGDTPLAAAKRWKNKTMAAFLIEHGAEE